MTEPYHFADLFFFRKKPLRSYTREYLFDKFRVEIHHQRQHLGVGARHGVAHRSNNSISASASASGSPVPHSISVHTSGHPHHPHHPAHPPPPSLASLPPPTPHNRPSSAASSVPPHGEPTSASRLAQTSLPPLSGAQHNPQSQQLPPLSAVTSAASEYEFDGDHDGAAVDGDGRYTRHHHQHHRGSGSHSRHVPPAAAMSPEVAHRSGIPPHGRPLSLQLPPHPHAHSHAHSPHANGAAMNGPYTRPPSAMDDDLRPLNHHHAASAPAAGSVHLTGYGFKSGMSERSYQI